ncbi:MAG: hypothetical protein GY739_21720 [Mesoflavibacter sp.]|nr:hypothetical protein [Mesoflavibacter sp.]
MRWGRVHCHIPPRGGKNSLYGFVVAVVVVVVLVIGASGRETAKRREGVAAY